MYIAWGLGNNVYQKTGLCSKLVLIINNWSEGKGAFNLGLIGYIHLLKLFGVQTWSMFPLEKSVVQLPLLGGDSRHSLPCLAIRASSAQAGWDPVLALPPARVCCGVHSVQCMGSGEVVTILLPPSRSWGLPEGETQEPIPMDRTGTSCKTSSRCGLWGESYLGKGVDFHSGGRRQRRSVC